jgi:hypothetical protein
MKMKSHGADANRERFNEISHRHKMTMSVAMACNDLTLRFLLLLDQLYCHNLKFSILGYEYLFEFVHISFRFLNNFLNFFETYSLFMELIQFFRRF